MPESEGERPTKMTGPSDSSLRKGGIEPWSDSTSTVEIKYPESPDSESEGPVIDQPINIDAAPRFYLGRLLDRIEFIVGLFAGTMTLLSFFTTQPLSAQISIALTVTAIGDFVIRHISRMVNESPDEEVDEE